jgi:hypothetical protein
MHCQAYEAWPQPADAALCAASLGSNGLCTCALARVHAQRPRARLFAPTCKSAGRWRVVTCGASRPRRVVAVAMQRADCVPAREPRRRDALGLGAARHSCYSVRLDVGGLAMGSPARQRRCASPAPARRRLRSPAGHVRGSTLLTSGVVRDTRDEERVTAKEPKDASFEGCLWPTLLDVSLHLHVVQQPAPGEAASRYRSVVDEVT